MEIDTIVPHVERGNELRDDIEATVKALRSVIIGMPAAELAEYVRESLEWAYCPEHVTELFKRVFDSKEIN